MMPYEINESERKTQILLFIPFGLIISFIFSYIIGVLIGGNFILFFPIFYLMIIGIAVVFYFWDRLDEKYGITPVRSSQLTLLYQGVVIWLLCVSPAFFFGMLMLGVMSGNIFFGLGGAVAVVYPIVGMFLRIKTFSDDSRVIGKKKVVLPDRERPLVVPKEALPDIKLSGKEVTETVYGFGFLPISYFIMAEALGVYTIGKGFSGINSYLINSTPSLEFIIASIAIGLLIQTVYLFPDKLNKIVPIELRTKNGFLFMFVMVFVLFGISQFLILIVRALTS